MIDKIVELLNDKYEELLAMVSIKNDSRIPVTIVIILHIFCSVSLASFDAAPSNFCVLKFKLGGST